MICDGSWPAGRSWPARSAGWSGSGCGGGATPRRRGPPALGWPRRSPAAPGSPGGAVRERGHAQALGKALAENYLDHGQVLCEGGDAGVGLSWLARSLEKSPANADHLRHTIRTQLAGWGRHVLPLQAYLDNPVPIT